MTDFAPAPAPAPAAAPGAADGLPVSADAPLIPRLLALVGTLCLAWVIVLRPLFGFQAVNADTDPALGPDLLLSAIAALGLLAWAAGGTRALGLDRPRGPLLWAALGFGLLAAASPAHALVRYLALAGASGWVGATLVLVGAWMLAARERARFTVLVLIALAGTGAALEALAQAAFGLEELRAYAAKLAAEGRLAGLFQGPAFQRRLGSDEVFGPFSTPNLLAALLLVSAPVTLGLLVRLARHERQGPLFAAGMAGAAVIGFAPAPAAAGLGVLLAGVLVGGARARVAALLTAALLAVQVWALRATGSTAALGALALGALVALVGMPRVRAFVVRWRRSLAWAAVAAALGAGALIASFSDDPWALRAGEWRQSWLYETPPAARDAETTPLAELTAGLRPWARSWCIRMAYLDGTLRALTLPAEDESGARGHPQRWRWKSRLIGSGFGGFECLYPFYRGPESVYVADPHNGYLRLLVEGGVLGLALFLLLLVGALVRGAWPPIAAWAGEEGDGAVTSRKRERRPSGEGQGECGLQSADFGLSRSRAGDHPQFAMRNAHSAIGADPRADRGAASEAPADQRFMWGAGLALVTAALLVLGAAALSAVTGDEGWSRTHLLRGAGAAACLLIYFLLQQGRGAEPADAGAHRPVLTLALTAGVIALAAHAALDMDFAVHGVQGTLFAALGLLLGGGAADQGQGARGKGQGARGKGQGEASEPQASSLRPQASSGTAPWTRRARLAWGLGAAGLLAALAGLGGPAAAANLYWERERALAAADEPPPAERAAALEARRAALDDAIAVLDRLPAWAAMPNGALHLERARFRLEQYPVGTAIQTLDEFDRVYVPALRDLETAARTRPFAGDRWLLCAQVRARSHAQHWQTEDRGRELTPDDLRLRQERGLRELLGDLEWALAYHREFAAAHWERARVTLAWALLRAQLGDARAWERLVKEAEADLDAALRIDRRTFDRDARFDDAARRFLAKFALRLAIIKRHNYAVPPDPAGADMYRDGSYEADPTDFGFALPTPRGRPRRP